MHYLRCTGFVNGVGGVDLILNIRLGDEPFSNKCYPDLLALRPVIIARLKEAIGLCTPHTLHQAARFPEIRAWYLVSRHLLSAHPSRSQLKILCCYYPYHWSTVFGGTTYSGLDKIAPSL